MIRHATLAVHEAPPHVQITLNGERYELERPMTMLDLLVRLEIDPRRVAIEHNLEIIRRFDYDRMTPESAAVLFWFVRNSLYFDLALDRRPDVALASYGVLFS